MDKDDISAFNMLVVIILFFVFIFSIGFMSGRFGRKYEYIKAYSDGYEEAINSLYTSSGK